MTLIVMTQDAISGYAECSVFVIVMLIVFILSAMVLIHTAVLIMRMGQIVQNSAVLSKLGGSINIFILKPCTSIC
jgi:hypothetical protein